jgi:hypothetical protein
MKKAYPIILAAAMVPLAGCINLSFGGRRPPPPPAPVIVTSGPVNSADAATIAEIDAASRLSFEPARKESLAAVAQRPGLSPTAQVHLVNAAYRSLDFEPAKVELLSALIANPSFCDPARQAIVTQLNRLSFDPHKQEILRRLNQRVTASHAH